MEVRINAEEATVIDTDVSTAAPAVLYRGQTHVLRRMILGVALDAMRAAKVQIPGELQATLARLPYELIHPVTAKDAIEFAYFLIDTTIQMQRFSDGTIGTPESIPGGGGPVQCFLIEPAAVALIARNTPSSAVLSDRLPGTS